MTPVAWFEERECHFTVMHKFEGQLFSAAQVGCRAPHLHPGTHTPSPKPSSSQASAGQQRPR
jgi:hypothetical protein